MSVTDDRKLCFVVMGFGLKTDFRSGQTFDLDATYEAIIEPAASSLGLRCIRADDLMLSGIIDVAMYEMLLRADLVIADISTGNVNAVYELGVRHALRPNSTIIMKEDQGKLYFDLDHVSTFQYEHLGTDIGARESVRARDALSTLMKEVLVAEKPDSPVYTYLPTLRKPILDEEEFAEMVDAAEAAQERLANFTSAGEKFFDAEQFEDAATAFARAAQIKPEDAYIIQRLALTTYKSKVPSELDALITGLSIIETLDPDNSNDPETLGITGAIRKRLWLLTKDRVQLDKAIKAYRRGYEVRRDYYNGENLATCFDLRSVQHKDAEEQRFDAMSARKIRERLLADLGEDLLAENFEERLDRLWVYATLANSAFGLGNSELGQEYEDKFMALAMADWMKETYAHGKEQALAAAKKN